MFYKKHSQWLRHFLFFDITKSWVKSLSFVKDDRTWNFSDRQWMWVLREFSMVFDSSNVSCHYSELLFLSLKVEYLKWGNTSFIFHVFNFPKMEIMERKEQMAVLWISEGMTTLKHQNRRIDLPPWCGGGTVSPASMHTISIPIWLYKYHCNKQFTLKFLLNLNHWPTLIYAVIESKALAWVYPNSATHCLRGLLWELNEST